MAITARGFDQNERQKRKTKRIIIIIYSNYNRITIKILVVSIVNIQIKPK